MNIQNSSPQRTTGNSPALQRWVRDGLVSQQARETGGRKSVRFARETSAVRFADFLNNQGSDPSDKSLGYFRSSVARTNRLL